MQQIFEKFNYENQELKTSHVSYTHTILDVLALFL